MLIRKSFSDKNKSIYKCDMCNKKVKINETNRIIVQKPYKSSEKYWDLCNRCLSKLISSIAKYNKKMEDK